MPQIRPITDLRNTTEISDICHAKREPVYFYRKGRGHYKKAPADVLERNGEIGRASCRERV